MTVNGTSAADSVTVTSTDVRQTSSRAAYAQVESLGIETGQGADTLTLDLSDVPVGRVLRLESGLIQQQGEPPLFYSNPERVEVSGTQGADAFFLDGVGIETPVVLRGGPGLDTLRWARPI